MFRKVILSGVSFASIPLAVSTVYAAEEKHKQEASASGKKLIIAKDLPIYDEHEPPRVEFVPWEQTEAEKYVSVVRKGVWNFMDSIQDTTNWCKDKYDIGKAHTNDMLVYLREDSGALPRAVFITVSGLGGIVAGYKGGIIRKMFFATVGLTTSAAICYPQQAIDISCQAWRQTPMYDMFGDVMKSKPAEEAAAVSKKISEAVTKNLDKLRVDDNAEKATEKSPKDGDSKSEKKSSDPKASKPPKEDHGMSKKEDKDLYTTRGN